MASIAEAEMTQNWERSDVRSPEDEEVPNTKQVKKSEVDLFFDDENIDDVNAELEYFKPFTVANQWKRNPVSMDREQSVKDIPSDDGNDTNAVHVIPALEFNINSAGEKRSKLLTGTKWRSLFDNGEVDNDADPSALVKMRAEQPDEDQEIVGLDRELLSQTFLVSPKKYCVSIC